MLSTAYPQVFHVVALIALIASIASFFYLRNKYLRDFPGRTTIEKLRAEVADLYGAHADLTDRFSRFQRKEGMREVRSAKQREQEILAEAQAIAGEAAPQEAADGDKLALYRRRRPLQ